MPETKIPAIHSVPANLDPALKRLLESIKEALEVRLGRQGDNLDQAITFRDLLDSGIAIGSLRVGQTIASPTPTPTPTNNDPPTGFTASCAFTKIMLTWDDHGLGTTFAYAEIYRSDGNLFDNAVPLATTTAAVYTDAVDYNQTWYYWVRFVSNAVPPVAGDWVGPASCTTAEDVKAVMTSLSEQLTNLPGYTTLINTTVPNLITTANSAFTHVIKSNSAPTTREDSTALQQGDIWIDTDDNNQMYIRNSANDAWVEARDGTLVTTVNGQASTISGHTSSIATNVTDIATVTSANTALTSTVNTLSATVDTKAKTFIQDGIPTSIAIGDIWIDSNDSNKMYRAASVGADQITSGEWVLVRDTVNDNYPRVFTQASPPTAINTGDIWFDTDDSNRHYRWDGSNWVIVRDVTTQAAVVTEASARASADTANANSITALTSTVNTKNQTFVQTSAPTAVAIGDLWIDSDDGNKLYRASATGTGNWVAVRDTTIATAQTAANTAITNAAGAQSTADGKVTTFFQAGIPGTGVKEGDLWIDSDDNKLYRAAADGADQIAANEWIEIQDDAIATAITNAATAQSTADGKIVSFYQAGIPGTNVKSGDLWIDTDDGNKLYRAAADGANEIAGGEWVAVGADTNTTFAQDGEPGSSGLITGDLWVDTNDNNKMYRWDGDSWEAIDDDRIESSADAIEVLNTSVGLSGAEATKITALEASIGRIYGARVITTNTSNNVKVETMTNVASSTTTATHGISAADVTAGVFISLKNAVATGGLTTQQLNKTFKVTSRINTTQLQIATVGDAATSAATSVTVVDGGTIGANAGLAQLATVTADIEGNAHSSYVLQVSANGSVAGMVIEANAEAGGTASAVQFVADKFAIWNGTVEGTNRTFDGSSASVVIVADDTITLSSADYNALYNTTAVTYSNGGGSDIGGLVNNTIYYVIKVASTTKIKLATTETLATAGTGRVLSAVGSGTSHTVNNVTSAPFIVSNGNVYIDAVRIQDAQIVGAKIADATIETAKIIDLNADKIRAGTLDASATIKVGSSGSGATDQRIEINAQYNRIVVVDGSS